VLHEKLCFLNVFSTKVGRRKKSLYILPQLLKLRKNGLKKNDFWKKAILKNFGGFVGAF